MSTYTDPRPECVTDTECYVNYWSIGFRATDGRRRVFELFDGNPLDRQGIATIFRNWRVYTFIGQKYDLPMIMLAMSGASNAELKQFSDDLIQSGVPHWTLMQRKGLTVPDYIDHVDLMNVSPGAPTMPSLKIYAGRLHSRKMQELPIEIDERIGEAERQIIRDYHGNDLEVTNDLKNDLKAQLELRALMSDLYGVDLRSKSDPQIAEAVVKHEIEKMLGRRVYPPDIQQGHFPYQVPAYVRYETPELQEALEFIRTARLKVRYDGGVDAPDRLKKLLLKIGGTSYQMGIGGLHSQEANVSHYSDDEYVLLDRDVTSYYPTSILLQGMYPKHLGPAFLKVYERLYRERIAAKKAGEKNKAESLKLACNGVFGKLGSPFSILYSPHLLIQVTLTGQLAILMLIERLELAGIHVVSANTDGIISKVPRDKRALFNAIFFDWECDSGYATEETEYISVHSQSVNSYIALKQGKNGEIDAKLKGPFTPSGPGLPGASGQKKNPNMDVCSDAVVEFLKTGKPVEDTIRQCTDPRRFVVVKRVTGGARDQAGEKIGKALRWYYATGVEGGFVYVKNGNAVPESIGAKLMMELPEELPDDVDYDYYIREAYATLEDLGVAAIDPKLRGRTGTLIARLPDQKTYHYVDASTGAALCGKRRSSIRESWVEIGQAPAKGVCSKCRAQYEL